MSERPQKITFGEMREMGARGRMAEKKIGAIDCDTAHANAGPRSSGRVISIGAVALGCRTRSFPEPASEIQDRRPPQLVASLIDSDPPSRGRAAHSNGIRPHVRAPLASDLAD